VKDEKIKVNKEDIKIRKSWGDVSPETKIEKVKTDYSRKDNRKVIQDALEEAEEDNLDIDFGY
jgi:hypothetical protein